MYYKFTFGVVLWLSLFWFNTALVSAKTIPQFIIYQNPTWGSTGTSLTTTELGSRFNTVIMSSGKLDEFKSTYLDAGLTNYYIYFIADNTAGPAGLDLVSAQTKPCTTTQKSYAVPSSNNVTAGTGDFCAIHDAIITNSCLVKYPDLCPTEAWFLHQNDGDRYYKDGYYRPNQGNAGWQQYFSRVASEKIGTNTGIFLDNLDMSFTQLTTDGGGYPPKEYPTYQQYDSAMISLIHALKSKIGSKQLIGNLNDLTASWDSFLVDMDGGLAESWGTNWNTTVSSTSELSTILTRAEDWLAHGKKLYLVTQGNDTGINNLWGLSLYLLISQPGAEYRYGLGSAYGKYFETPEYAYQLGSALGSRTKVSDSPLVYERCFIAGKVTVDLSAKKSVISQTPCSSLVSPTPKPWTTLESDYSTWSTNYLRSLTGFTSGDFSENGVVDGIDYVLWLINYAN